MTPQWVASFLEVFYLGLPDQGLGPGAAELSHKAAPSQDVEKTAHIGTSENSLGQ